MKYRKFVLSTLAVAAFGAWRILLSTPDVADTVREAMAALELPRQLEFVCTPDEQC